MEINHENRVIYTSKWPNGATLTTIIKGDAAEDMITWGDRADGRGASIDATGPRPLTWCEQRLRDACSEGRSGPP